VDPAGRTYGEIPSVAIRHMRFARDLRDIGRGPLVALGHLGHRLAADDPATRLELTGDLLVMPAQYAAAGIGRDLLPKGYSPLRGSPA
jgi:hypothetical protein